MCSLHFARCTMVYVTRADDNARCFAMWRPFGRRLPYFLKTYAQKCLGKDDCSLFQLKGLPKDGLEDALFETTAKHGLLVLAWAVGQGT